MNKDESQKKSISNAKLYGLSDVEKWIDKKNEVYQIKSQINKFGITDKQRYFLLLILSEEIENIENSRELSALVLKCCPSIKVLQAIEEIKT